MRRWILTLIFLSAAAGLLALSRPAGPAEETGQILFLVLLLLIAVTTVGGRMKGL
jgi:uncharacterized membrane protein YtjA (UPF0391 family)